MKSRKSTFPKSSIVTWRSVWTIRLSYTSFLIARERTDHALEFILGGQKWLDGQAPLRNRAL